MAVICKTMLSRCQDTAKKMVSRWCVLLRYLELCKDKFKPESITKIKRVYVMSQLKVALNHSYFKIIIYVWWKFLNNYTQMLLNIQKTGHK